MMCVRGAWMMGEMEVRRRGGRRERRRERCEDGEGEAGGREERKRRVVDGGTVKEW